jgi:hypothetical protein
VIFKVRQEIEFTPNAPIGRAASFSAVKESMHTQPSMQ